MQTDRIFHRVQPPRVALALALLATAFASPAAAQQGAGRGAMMQACRADYQTLCAGTLPGGGRIAQCMRDHASQLSAGCRAAIVENRQQRQGSGTALDLPAGTKVERNIAYGSAPEQRMDVYHAAEAKNAPIIVMVHGGAWAFGSKSARGVVKNKVAHWLPKGYVFVSVETRLVPKADPLQQAGDVAAALASVQQKAASFGGDPSRIVLMGHSAGAHLVSLVTADRTIADKAGAKSWLGTVALDSAAYDVSKIMKQPRHAKFYDEAFGSSPDFWVKASPTLQAKGAMPPMLLVCSSLRTTSCPQAETLAAKAGGKAKVLPVALRHQPINVELGQDSAYTRDVDAFLTSLGLP